MHFRGSRRLKELATIGADISDASLRKAIDCVDISDIAVILTSTVSWFYNYDHVQCKS